MKTRPSWAIMIRNSRVRFVTNQSNADGRDPTLAAESSLGQRRLPPGTLTALPEPATMRRARGRMAFVGAAVLARGPLAGPRSLCGMRGNARRSHGAACVRRAVVQASTAAERGRTQQETEWNRVRVVENSVHCEAHRYVVINVGTTGATGSLADAYRYPGMYVKMRRDAECPPAFLALSCAPNIAGYFEFLIKDSDSTAWVADLAVGDDVQMSPVMGRGFPISPTLDLLGYPPIPEDEVPRDILLFATGSGIAPIRASIESLLNGLNIVKRRSVKLYYGARYPERMPYMDRFQLWKEDGVEVIPVMSRPGESKQKWEGRTGYVQDALKEDSIPYPKQTGALLCGVKGMTEDVRQILVDAGVQDSRILLNF